MKLTIDQMKQQFVDWFVKRKDEEYEKSLDPAWKKLRPSKDALNYKLPGHYRG